MTTAQLRKLVTDAIVLHREIAAQNERLKNLKATLVRESRLHKKEFTLTDNGGSRWTATGTDGCIARVTFPAPALISRLPRHASVLKRRNRKPSNCECQP